MKRCRLPPRLARHRVRAHGGGRAPPCAPRRDRSRTWTCCRALRCTSVRDHRVHLPGDAGGLDHHFPVNVRWIMYALLIAMLVVFVGLVARHVQTVFDTQPGSHQRDHRQAHTMRRIVALTVTAMALSFAFFAVSQGCTSFRACCSRSCTACDSARHHGHANRRRDGNNATGFSRSTSPRRSSCARCLR